VLLFSADNHLVAGVDVKADIVGLDCQSREWDGKRSYTYVTWKAGFRPKRTCVGHRMGPRYSCAAASRITPRNQIKPASCDRYLCH
jgi:hypothetical protein